MLGFQDRKTEPIGPFEFCHSVEIERQPADIYALIDWADERNAKRALGNRVERIGAGQYRLHLGLVPGHVFDMTVTEERPGEAYAFDTEITPPVGRLVSCGESYTLSSREEHACTLDLRVRASFAGGLSEEELATQLSMMAFACENALAKLKLHAERGVNAVRQLEAAQMGLTGEEAAGHIGTRAPTYS